jgi:hypothetical protein
MASTLGCRGMAACSMKRGVPPSMRSSFLTDATFFGTPTTRGITCVYLIHPTFMQRQFDDIRVNDKF